MSNERLLPLPVYESSSPCLDMHAVSSPDMVQQEPQAMPMNRELPEAAAVTVNSLGQRQSTGGAGSMVIQKASACRLTVCACRSCGLC